MPNHIQNRTQFIAKPARLMEIWKAIGEHDETGKTISRIDFNRIIPQPANIFNGNLGEPEKAQCLLDGRPNWYDWNNENWGTKWGAYHTPDDRDTMDTTYYQTAWATSFQIIEKLAEMFPDVEIVHTWADEDAGSNTGRIRLKGEMVLEDFRPKYGDEGMKLYFELHPESREDYEYINGKWEYKED